MYICVNKTLSVDIDILGISMYMHIDLHVYVDIFSHQIPCEVPYHICEYMGISLHSKPMTKWDAHLKYPPIRPELSYSSPILRHMFNIQHVIYENREVIYIYICFSYKY